VGGGAAANLASLMPNEALKKPNDSQNPTDFEGASPLPLWKIVVYSPF